MFGLNRMSFNKPQNTRQYGNSTLNFDHTQDNMVQLKPEYLGDDRFKFLNNFGLQAHLIKDKKFADIYSVKPANNCVYPTNYVTSDRKNIAHPIQTEKVQDVIPLPEVPPKTETTLQPQLDIKHNLAMANTCKKNKRRRKAKQEGGPKSPYKMKNPNKLWHKTSLKFDLMEMEDVDSEKALESPVTPLDLKIETLDQISVPMNIIDVIEFSNKSVNFSPTVSPNNISPQKLEPHRHLRLPSECESEDSFIIFDSSSTSFDTDIIEVDEFGYTTSEGEDDDDEDDVCSFISSLEDVSPTKRVRFADDKDLCEVHPMVQWSYAYQKARKGPWEQYALDRTRFQRRISDLESTLSGILQPEHRNKIYNERFKTKN